jgi:aspartate aminotransferase-like enzyme
MIYKDYAIFTPGPVKMSDEILAIGSEQTPYFRNQKFSGVVLRSEELLLKMAGAPRGSRVVFLTASGTAGMEASVMNLLGSEDRAIVINGGGFGQRFVDLCVSHGIEHIALSSPDTDLADIEERIDPTDHTALVVNAHETSVGHLYDLDALGAFAQKHDLFTIVDAISMFVTDPLDMSRQHIDALIVSSQKGLALPPGLTMVILSPRAIDRLRDVSLHYFNFRNYLKDGERGQTPYTPAVTIVLQLLARLEQIERDGGIEASWEQAARIATYFREGIRGLPLKPFTDYMPNAMTTLTPTDGRSAMQIVRDLEERYRVMVCPNGGALSETIFRVSHMGDMTEAYVDKLLEALWSYYQE